MDLISNAREGVELGRMKKELETEIEFINSKLVKFRNISIPSKQELA